MGVGIDPRLFAAETLEVSEVNLERQARRMNNPPSPSI